MFYKALGLALTLLGTFTLAIPKALTSEISISPTRFEVDINGKKRSQLITITNHSSEPLEMKAYVKNWTLNENNQVQEAPSSEKTLDQWIIFTPSRFTVPPNSKQTVRFSIRPKVQPANGEHRAILYLEEAPPENNNTSKTVATYARMGIVIYANMGQVKRIATLNSINVNVKPKNTVASFDVSSIGNGYVRFKGQYAIWPAANYPGAKTTTSIPGLGTPQVKLPNNVLQAGELELPPVLPGNRRQLLLPLSKKLPPGNYVLDINGELSGMPVDKGIPFTIITGNSISPTSKSSAVKASSQK
jgi:P pilus assembly chaperone PapD